MSNIDTAYMYILKCADGSYYTGSTVDMERRLAQHQAGEGANYTKKHLPVELVYCEECQCVDDAYRREKQVQGWTRRKKEALISGHPERLPELAALRQAQGTPFDRRFLSVVEGQGTQAVAVVRQAHQPRSRRAPTAKSKHGE
jgi:predicted GIY-YIG superfamily endonuclease